MVLTVTLNPSMDNLYTLENGTEPVFIHLGHSNRIGKPKASAGGKGINVAKVMRILGAPVKATGFYGGVNGRKVMRQLKKKKIDADFVRVNQETRGCVSIREQGRKRQTELLEKGPDISAQEKEEFLALYTRLLKECSWVQIGGSVPDKIDTAFYSSLIEQAKKAGKKVFLDTSNELLQASLQAAPTAIKPNRDELAHLFCKESVKLSEVAAYAAQLQRDYGIETVIVSLGSSGAYFALGENRYRGKVPRTAAVSTVGCGDSLVAGYLTACEQGLDEETALKYALAASVANTMTWEPGHLRLQDFKRLLKEVKIKKLR